MENSSREHDLVIYGATGFVGELIAAYLAAHAPAGLCAENKTTSGSNRTNSGNSHMRRSAEEAGPGPFGGSSTCGSTAEMILVRRRERAVHRKGEPTRDEAWRVQDRRQGLGHKGRRDFALSPVTSRAVRSPR
ncbi:hypothetical protein [Arthrobacter sp. H20]|uniref:hypothetical protein n=1 Tax=Arthrobacter sp. H20 TaxID=1267981 RepID=UPI0004AE535E|nr:hypothetical protein [Arthrobacter sp. H20]